MAPWQVDKMTSELERRRKLGRMIVHVDMDAFYAAVEMRDCPELKDKPMAVGSMGMLVSCHQLISWSLNGHFVDGSMTAKNILLH